MNIFGKIKETMAAVAFAEADEPDMALQFLKTGKNADKKVLLGTDEHPINTKTLYHALSLCRRMGTSLEIFQLLQPQAEQLKGKNLQQQTAFQSQCKKFGIIYRTIKKESRLIDELAPYCSRRKDILIVVIQQTLRRDEEGSQKDVASYFHCPVAFLTS
ncbi:MAG: hypothetical protein KAJ60_04220 [Desulfobulbaceae bacterium]|nr:hypothetical protein [Desulfobulbaceae bacterium]MCK5340254.1 hypothetical protein [Desulfobulbaceae bacterium]